MQLKYCDDEIKYLIHLYSNSFHARAETCPIDARHSQKVVHNTGILKSECVVLNHLVNLPLIVLQVHQTQNSN